MNQNTNVIEWKDPGTEELLFSFPDENIRWGSSLVVKEWEYAIFMRDGKLFDVFKSGRYILSTQNVPLLTRTYNFLLGYKETPFKVNVIFVSRKIFNGRWGVRSMVKAAEGFEAPIPLMSHGNFQFRIDDPVLFLTQVVGGDITLNTAVMNEFLKGFLNEKLIQEFAKYMYMDVFSQMEKTSTRVMVNISDVMKQRGVEIISLNIENVDTEEQYKEDIYKFERFRSQGGFEYRKFETMDKMAESIGTSGGAGIGAGMVLFPQMYQNLMSNQGTVLCPNCNSSIQPGTRFCPQCGNEVIPKEFGPRPSTHPPVHNSMCICPFCGTELRFVKTPKFCPYCKENIEPV